MRCAFTHDDARVVAADFQGRATLWDAKTGKRLSDLDVNPRRLSERIAEAHAALRELQQRSTNSSPPPALAALEEELKKLNTRTEAAQKEADQAKADFTAKAQVVARLKETAAGANPPADTAAQLATAREVREKARQVNTTAIASLETVTRKLNSAKEKLERLRANAPDLKVEMARAESELQRLTRAQQLGGAARPVVSGQ